MYPVKPGDTCEKLTLKFFGGNWTDFYSLNPGLYCDQISGGINSKSIPGQEVGFSSPCFPPCFPLFFHFISLPLPPFSHCFPLSFPVFPPVSPCFSFPLFSPFPLKVWLFFQVCLEATGVGLSRYKKNCARNKGQYFTVPSKARCATLLTKYYRRDMRVFKRYNNGARCLDTIISRLRGKCMCAPSVPAAQRCTG